MFLMLVDAFLTDLMLCTGLPGGAGQRCAVSGADGTEVCQVLDLPGPTDGTRGRPGGAAHVSGGRPRRERGQLLFISHTCRSYFFISVALVWRRIRRDDIRLFIFINYIKCFISK